MSYPEPIAKLIESYMKLPGIGQKAATRFAFYTIDTKEEDANASTKVLISVKRDPHFCSIRGNITEEDPCEICQDKNRDRSIILIVEEPEDVMVMEKMCEYQGLYHILHEVPSPMEGIGPEDINITSLIKRLHDDGVKKVITATNAITEGEATATYLSRLIKSAGITVTHLAHGLSVGGDIEYVDEIILLKVVEGRRGT